MTLMKPNWGRPPQTGNNSHLLSNINTNQAALLLNISGTNHMIHTMKKLIPILLSAALIAITTPAQAADCYADYKAKQDNPLRLHYGVAQINGPCKTGAAQAELAPRLAAQGWTLLSILSTFDATGLAERKTSAGPNYLRF